MDVNRELEGDGKLLGISLGQKKNRQFIAWGTQKDSWRRRRKGRSVQEQQFWVCGLWYTAPTDVAVPAEQPSRARAFPAPGRCLPAVGHQQSLNKARYSHETVGHTCKDGSSKGWGFAQEAHCYKQSVCTIFALRRVCVVLHGLWWSGLHGSRSLNKGSTSRFVLISFTVFRNIGVSQYLHWVFPDFFLSSSHSLSELYVSPPYGNSQLWNKPRATLVPHPHSRWGLWWHWRCGRARGHECQLQAVAGGAGAQQPPHSSSQGRRRAAAAQTSGRLRCGHLRGRRRGLAKVAAVTLQ